MELTNQKEYLKKYLPNVSRDGKRRKKKRKAIAGESVIIIDDDIDISQVYTPREAIDLLQTKEDAPQIVGVIDERPMHLRVKDYQDSNLWKPVGEQVNIDDSIKPDRVKTSFQIGKPSIPLLSNKSLKPRKVDNDSVHSNSKDRSPPRRKRVARSPSRLTNSPSKDNSPPRRRLKDSSPPRRRRKDSSPPRTRPKDSSPPRRRTNSLSKHSSPSRRHPTNDRHTTNKRSPSRPKTLETSPKRRKLLPGNSKGKYLIPAKRTLDGKTAGLQNAKDLVTETLAFRKREDELFKNMDKEVSGANAATIIRDRKTGKIRDFLQEAKEREAKEKMEEETKAKYMQWGKGLKQTADLQNKIADELHEMSKPLARYADDEDLEKYLKERERDEDPMLQYIRSKRKKKDVEAGKPIKPLYLGEFAPNRYKILPGHRWDGVDRSNGYEQRWLEAQNAKLALQEDVYKWSTEDM